MTVQPEPTSRIPDKAPAEASAPILEQHRNIRLQLERLRTLATGLRQGGGNPTLLRAQLLELSVFLIGHFDAEERTLATVAQQSGRPPIALTELHREHEVQHRELDMIAANALSLTLTTEQLADLTERLIVDVETDMEREELWLWARP